MIPPVTFAVTFSLTGHVTLNSHEAQPSSCAVKQQRGIILQASRKGFLNSLQVFAVRSVKCYWDDERAPEHLASKEICEDSQERKPCVFPGDLMNDVKKQTKKTPYV